MKNTIKKTLLYILVATLIVTPFCVSADSLVANATARTSTDAIRTSTDAIKTPTDAAYDFSGICGAQGDNLTWYIDTSTFTLVIEGEGDMADYTNSYNSDPWAEHSAFFKNIKIKNGVTSIGDYAFRSCSYKNINIGSSVSKIGELAFSRDTKTIKIDSDNNFFTEENNIIFSKDKKNLIYAFNQDLYFYIPEGVVTLAKKSLVDIYYRGGSAEKSNRIYLSSTIENMSVESFYDYYVHKEYDDFDFSCNLILNENNQKFTSDNYAIYNKDKTILLMSTGMRNAYYDYYIIPETVTEIADYAFVTERRFNGYIPDNVKSIGFCSFSSVSKNLFIPDSVSELDEKFTTSTSGYIYYGGSEEEWKTLYPYETDLKVIYNHKHLTDRISTCEEEYDYCVVCENITYYQKYENPAHIWERDYYEAPTCTRSGYEYLMCSVPGCYYEKEVILEPVDHAYEEYTYTKEATCTEDAVITFHCKWCNQQGETKTVEGSALGHTYADKWTVLSHATCSQDGLSVRACKYCWEIEASNEKAYGHFDENADGKCDDCSCVLEVSDPVTPDDSDDSDNSDEEPQKNNFLTFFTNFFNKIVAFFKKLFKMA